MNDFEQAAFGVSTVGMRDEPTMVVPSFAPFSEDSHQRR
jgi:hypothetical protein